jgi:hypothetical protein
MFTLMKRKEDSKRILEKLFVPIKLVVVHSATIGLQRKGISALSVNANLGWRS